MEISRLLIVLAIYFGMSLSALPVTPLTANARLVFRYFIRNRSANSSAAMSHGKVTPVDKCVSPRNNL